MMTKYSRCAALDSMVGQAGSPKTLRPRILVHQDPDAPSPILVDTNPTGRQPITEDL